MSSSIASQKGQPPVIPIKAMIPYSFIYRAGWHHLFCRYSVNTRRPFSCLPTKKGSASSSSFSYPSPPSGRALSLGKSLCHFVLCGFYNIEMKETEKIENRDLYGLERRRVGERPETGSLRSLEIYIETKGKEFSEMLFQI